MKRKETERGEGEERKTEREREDEGEEEERNGTTLFFKSSFMIEGTTEKVHQIVLNIK